MKLHLPLSLRLAILSVLSLGTSALYAAGNLIVANKTVREVETGTANSSNYTLTAKAYAAYSANITYTPEVDFSGNRTYASVIITTNYSNYYSEPKAYAYGGAFLCSGNVTLSYNDFLIFDANLVEAYAEATYTNSSYYENQYTTADAYGGAIYSSNYNITIANNAQVVFKNNTAYASHPKLYGDARGHAYAYGGAIANLYGDTVIGNNGYVLFDNNAAGSGGAAIYTDRGNITLINNGKLEIKNNQKKALYSKQGYIDLTDNIELCAYGNKECVFYAKNVSLTRSSTADFHDNTATGYTEGGSVFNCYTLALNQNHSLLFTDNAADYYGGAIEVWESLQMNDNTSVTFSGNESYYSAGAICITGAKGKSEIKGNGTITFSENCATANFTRTNDKASISISEALSGGALYSSAELTISNNTQLVFDKNHVTVNGSATSNSAYASYKDVYSYITLGAYGGAIYSAEPLNFLSNGSITFSNSSVNSKTTSVATNYSESDLECHASAHSGAHSSAVYLRHNSQESLWKGNNSITFKSNTAWASSTADTAEAYTYGGVMQLGNYSTLIVDQNGNISYTQNTTEIEAYTVDAYETSFGSWRIAYAHADIYGGVLYVGTDSMLVFQNNGNLSFTQNTCTSQSSNMANVTNVSSSRVELTSLCIARGGVINCTGGSCDFYNNELIEFSGNSVTSTASMGGKISGTPINATVETNARIRGGVIALESATMSLFDNEDVIFRENTINATAVKQSTADSRTELYILTYGAALYVDSASTFTLGGNHSVIFEKNLEINNDTYRLRSIGSDGILNLSATDATDTITFYDTITADGTKAVVHLNPDYTNDSGITRSGNGHIIFSGKYTEEHLNQLLKKNGKSRSATSSEITNSRTSYAETTYLHSGRVTIEDGAVYSGATLTLLRANSGTTTLELSGGSLNYSSGHITLQAGTELLLNNCNNNITASTLTLEKGSSLRFSLSSVNTTSALLSFSGYLAADSGSTLNIDCDSVLPESGTYKLLTVSSMPGTWNNLTINTHLGLQNIRWVNNTLVADFSKLTWSNSAGTRKWDSSARNWSNGSASTTYSASKTVEFYDSGYGSITLSGNLAPSLLWMQNSSGCNYSFTGTGALTGSMQLQKRGAGTLSISTANSYTGGTILYAGKLVANHAKAFGTGKIELLGGTLDMNDKALTNAIYASAGSISGGSSYAGKLYVDGSVNLTENLHAGKGIEINSGELYGKSIVDTNIIVNAPNQTINLGSALNGESSISLNSGYLQTDSSLNIGAQQSLNFDGGHLLCDLKATDGGTINVTTHGQVDGDMSVYDGQLIFDFGNTLEVLGNLSINGEVVVKLNGNYEEDRTYTLIETSGNMSIDFSKLAGEVTQLGDRYGCNFSATSQGLSVTIVEVGTTLTWAGGPDDIWCIQGGVWEDGKVYNDGDTVILGDGTVTLRGWLAPRAVHIKPQEKLTVTAEDDWGYIEGNDTYIIIEAAPDATVIFDVATYHRGDTIIRSGTVKFTDNTYFSNSQIVLEGGTLDLANNWESCDITLTGKASILKGKNHSGSFTMLGGELLKGSVLNSYWDMNLNGGLINGTLTCDDTTHINGVVTIGDYGKLNTGTLHLHEDGILTTSAKGLALNAKTSDLIFNGGKLISLNKLTAYSLTMSGGQLDMTNAKPMALTISDQANLRENAHISLYGKLTAASLEMNQSSITMNMAPEDVTEKLQPKPQSLTLKDKYATGTLTDSSLNLNGSMSVAGNLELHHTTLSLKDTGAKPKALGLTVKGALTATDNSEIYATGKVALASLMLQDSTLTICNSKPQSLALNGKTNADKQAIYNNITNSSLLLNGSMSVASHLMLSNATIQLKDANSAKPKALGLTVKGDLWVSDMSQLYLSGALSAKNLTLGSGDIYMTSTKQQTIKVSNELTLNGGTYLHFGFSVTQKDVEKDKAFKILTFKVLDDDIKAADLYSLLGLSEEICILDFDKSRKSITLEVENYEKWNKQAEDIRNAELATAVEEEAEDMLFAPATTAEAMAPELKKAADTLVQSTWGTVGASRAFGDTIANRGTHATLLEGGKGAAWISTMGGSSRISSEAGHAGADYTLTGAAFGIEAHLSTDSTLGIAIGNSWGKVSTFSAYPVDQDSSHAGIYGNHKLSDTLSLSWMAAHTRTESDVNLVGMPCSWSQDALQLDARLTWAKALNARTSVNAFGGLQYLATDSGECNGIKSGSLQNLRAEIGVGATHRFTGDTMAYGELSFIGDVVRNNPTADLGGLRSHGTNPGRAGMNLSVGATHSLNDDWSVNATYNLELMQNITSHGLNVGATYNF